MPSMMWTALEASPLYSTATILQEQTAELEEKKLELYAELTQVFNSVAA